MKHNPFTKPNRWIWSAALFVALLHPLAYIIVVELWYYTVFAATRTSAPEHYTTSRRRYCTTSISVVALSLIYAISERLYAVEQMPLSPQAYAVSRTILLFILILMAVWQIVILLNAYSYSIDGNNFKNSRARYLLLIILAPIGALLLSPQPPRSTPTQSPLHRHNAQKNI